MAKALTDPLGVEKQTLKELGIKEDVVSPVRKLAFLQAQYEEMESVFWRSRMDVVHAKRLTESDNEVLRNKGLERESTHKNEVRQFWGGIQMIKRMIEQLREEHPELQVEE